MVKEKPTIEEGCIFDGARGIYIPYNVVNFAIQMGFNPSIEWKQCIKEAKEKKEDEEEFLTYNYEWIYEEMENAEFFLNDKYAKEGYYFGILPDLNDWGYWKVEEEDMEMEE